MKTLNELDYGMSPKDMGTTGLVIYVRGHFWPYVPENTCFVAREEFACEIVKSRGGDRAVAAFRKAVRSTR